MTRKTWTNVILGVFLALAIVAALFYFLWAPSGGPAERILGIWSNPDETVRIEFQKDGRFVGRFRHSVASNVQPPRSVENFKIDLGFELVTFEGSKKFPGQAIGPGAIGRHEVQLEYVPLQGKVTPWVKRLLSSGSRGELTVHYASVSPSSADKPADQALVAIAVHQGEKTVPIQGLTFAPFWFDEESRWVGFLEARGSYRFTNGGAFEMTIPMTTGSSSLGLLVCEGIVKRRTLDLKSTSFLVEPATLSRSNTTIQTGKPATKAGFAIGSFAAVEGIKIRGDVYVNTGVTIGRMQNLAFRLPGREMVGKFVVTEAEQSESPMITISEGAYYSNSPLEQHAANAFDAMLTPKGTTLSMVLGADGLRHAFELPASRKADKK